MTSGFLEFPGTITYAKRQNHQRSAWGRVYFPGKATPRQPSTATRMLVGKVRFTGFASPLKTYAYGAFRDWAHYSDTMVDPAKVLYVGSEGGVAYDGAALGNMRRIWGTVAPPTAYRSGDGLLWPRAAFMSVGLRVKNMPVDTWQYVDGAQVEMTPKGVTGPSPYVPARSLDVVVKADDMNYVLNPQTTSAVTSGASVTRPISGVDGKFYAGVVRVLGAPVNAVVRVTVEDTTGVIADTGPVTVPPPGSTILTVKALRPSRGTILLLRMAVVSSTAAVTFALPRVDRVTGPGALNDSVYVDGGMGDGYMWGGAANNSESYFYRNFETRSYLLGRVLEENSPLGVVAGVPKFAVLPTE